MVIENTLIASRTNFLTQDNLPQVNRNPQFLHERNVSKQIHVPCDSFVFVKLQSYIKNLGSV